MERTVEPLKSLGSIAVAQSGRSKRRAAGNGEGAGCDRNVKSRRIFHSANKGKGPAKGQRQPFFENHPRFFETSAKIREQTPVKDWSHGGATPLAEVDVNASYTGTVTNVGQCLDVFG